MATIALMCMHLACSLGAFSAKMIITFHLGASVTRYKKSWLVAGSPAWLDNSPEALMILPRANVFSAAVCSLYSLESWNSPT